MKKELEIKKEMEELKKKMDSKREDINDEIIPGSYFYDVEKVEILEEEIKNMKEEYDRLEAMPTKEKIEAEKEFLNKELQKVNEELEEFAQGGIYFPTEEMIQLEGRKNELKKEIAKKDEILEVINEIEKTENEIEELHEEENEYIGAYFIPDEILKGIEEKNQKLDELNKKLEEYTNERIGKEFKRIEKTNKKEKNMYDNSKENSTDKREDSKDDFDKKAKEMDEKVKQYAKFVSSTEKNVSNQDHKQVKNDLDEVLEKNIEIKIDKKGAKVIFGDKKFEIKNSEIKEIVNEIIKGDKAQYAKYISKLAEYKTEYNSILKEIDPFIIACASKIKNYSGDNSSVLEPMMAEALTKRYLEMYTNKEKDEKFNITYDLKSLSKPSGLISRIKKEFWSLSDKIAITERAKRAKQLGLAETEGDFKPSFIDKIFAKVENFANNRLNAKNEKAKKDNVKKTSEVKKSSKEATTFKETIKEPEATAKTDKVSREYNDKEEQKHLANNIQEAMDQSKGSNEAEKSDGFEPEDN